MRDNTTEPNEPCPCGSGNKYNQCCGIRTPIDARQRRTTANLAPMAVLTTAALLLAISFGFIVTESTEPAIVPSAKFVPKPVPAAKAGSLELNKSHDTPIAVASAPSPALQESPGTPAPPGPAPAGKIWSEEHGHWHEQRSMLSELLIEIRERLGN